VWKENIVRNFFAEEILFHDIFSRAINIIVSADFVNKGNCLPGDLRYNTPSA